MMQIISKPILAKSSSYCLTLELEESLWGGFMICSCRFLFLVIWNQRSIKVNTSSIELNYILSTADNSFQLLFSLRRKIPITVQDIGIKTSQENLGGLHSSRQNSTPHQNSTDVNQNLKGVFSELQSCLFLVAFFTARWRRNAKVLVRATKTNSNAVGVMHSDIRIWKKLETSNWSLSVEVDLTFTILQIGESSLQIWTQWITSLVVQESDIQIWIASLRLHSECIFEIYLISISKITELPCTVVLCNECTFFGLAVHAYVQV